ncbi:kinase-like protein [Hypoxylon sp. NC1633]|nr:kinase-like protein [Hypoxylon sp. NC1633]
MLNTFADDSSRNSTASMPSIMAESAFRGLKWVSKTFSIEPAWTMEPDLEAATQIIKSHLNKHSVTISSLAQGAFNKVYEVTSDEDEETFILRIALPVDPEYKTLSEVATMGWMAHNSNIPVPVAVASDSSNANSIGFEWMLMTRVPGKPLADAWRSLPFPAKVGLVERFADFSSRLFRRQLSCIGNIYTRSPAKVQRIVAMHFFWGDHIHQNVHRGPFTSSRDWIKARLSLNEHDCHSTMAKCSVRNDLDSDDEDALEDAERTLQIIERLSPLIDQIFPPSQSGDEPSMLFHDDLSMHNILVDNTGAISGVVDWECVSALPLWKACYFPSFLESSTRPKEPDRTRYQLGPDGQPVDLYWEHMLEFELTNLRGVFLDEVTRLEPKWMEVFMASSIQRDLDTAVRNCDNEFLARDINDWIEDFNARGDGARSLRDRIDEF